MPALLFPLLYHSRKEETFYACSFIHLRKKTSKEVFFSRIGIRIHPAPVEKDGIKTITAAREEKESVKSIGFRFRSVCAAAVSWISCFQE